MAYFRSVAPELYGVRHVEVSDEEVVQGPTPGSFYVVSGHIVAYVPPRAREVVGSGAEWLLEEPTAIVGHAYYIFDFGGSASPSLIPPP